MKCTPDAGEQYFNNQPNLSAANAVSVGAAATVGGINAVLVKTGLQPGDVLLSGQSILSPNGQYRLTMQGDGNLVSYTSANAPIWASGTSAPG